jgi:hypothetical protein
MIDRADTICRGESRRVLKFVNGEIERWNAGEREDAISHLLDVARERLRKVAG